jgi:hypothetical protein
MNDQHCDVIGCPAPARWVRSGTTAAESANFICATHWQELKTLRPAEAVMFSPLAAKTEGDIQLVPHRAAVMIWEPTAESELESV